MLWPVNSPFCNTEHICKQVCKLNKPLTKLSIFSLTRFVFECNLIGNNICALWCSYFAEVAGLKIFLWCIDVHHANRCLMVHNAHLKKDTYIFSFFTQILDGTTLYRDSMINLWGFKFPLILICLRVNNTFAKFLKVQDIRWKYLRCNLKMIKRRWWTNYNSGDQNTVEWVSSLFFLWITKRF